MARTLRIGFKTAPTRVTWDQVRSIWHRAGEFGVFESAWLFDHFYPVDGDGSCFEGMTALAALAPLVPGHQVGHLVLANPYRHPGLVAKSASVIDHVSGGSFVLGLGAGVASRRPRPTASRSTRSVSDLRDLRAAILVIRELLKPEAGAWPDDGAQFLDHGRCVHRRAAVSTVPRPQRPAADAGRPDAHLAGRPG